MSFDTFTFFMFCVIGTGLSVLGLFLAATFWDEVLKPNIYGPNGSWRRQKGDGKR